MRSSWNFSTVIFEIWVLVLTKPGWANETPTTSLRVPGEHNYHNQNHHHHHHVQHHHHHNQHHHQSHYQHEQNYAVEGNSRDSNSNHKYHHHSSHPHQNQPRSLASTYYSNGNNNHHHSHHLDSAASSSSLYTPHRCYVCLPPNKNSKEAQQIINMFAKEVRPLIPDCSAFDPYVDTARFEFDCPPVYSGGCILRIHGSNISRACSSRFKVNECKKANSVEFCYCTSSLCNDKKPEPAVIPAVVHVSRTTDVRRRGSSSGSIGNSRSRSSSSQIGENSQGIRSRVSDDEDILNRDDEEDDDDDNGGSGTGSPDQQLQTLIDPFTSTTDPTIYHEETVVVAVEDPNPHTKIGISMTASTSSSSSSVIATSWSWSSSQGATKRCGSTMHSIFHLFVHLHRTLFVHLFAEQVVDDQHDADDDSNHYLRSNQNQESRGEKVEAAETTGLPFILYSQLCFIISLVVLNRLLS